MPPQVNPGADKGVHTCDILVYGAPLSAHARGHAHAHAPTSASVADEESDKHVRISWADALAATLVGAVGFPMTNPATGADVNVAPVGVGADMSLTDWKKAADAIGKYNDGTSKDWDAINKDIRIVVARPFIEHMMHSAILAVGGRETGATCAISQFERRLCDRRRLWLFPCAQCSARRTCSSRPTPRSRPSRVRCARYAPARLSALHALC